MEEAERKFKCSTGFIIQEGALWRGSPVRELEPTAAYRLGVDTGEQSGGEILLGRKMFSE
jgi:hypothetical protein